MRVRYSFFVILATLILAVPINALATTYDVNRSFTDIDGSSLLITLTGTLDIAGGDYTILDKGTSPFTAVNLTLAVGGNSYVLNYVLTDKIDGTGQFLISATPTQLIFNVAGSPDAWNPADLIFSDNTTRLSSHYFYNIGFDGVPGFETANVNETPQYFSWLSFTDDGIVFGTVPEPATMLLLGLGLVGLAGARRFKK